MDLFESKNWIPLSLLLLAIILITMMITNMETNKANCQERGGVYVHEHCFKKDLFLE